MNDIIKTIMRALGLGIDHHPRRYAVAGLSSMLLLAPACGDLSLEFGSSDTDDDMEETDGATGDSGAPGMGSDADESSGADESGSGEPAAECNNATVEGDEECDRVDLAGQDCLSLGFDGGTLSCAADCTFDTSSCTVDLCGNDSVDEGEVCDGSDFGGESCESLGFDGGELACADDCMALDRSGCVDDQPGTGDDDCCLAAAGPGCENAVCEAAVCEADPFCCEHAWDEICAGQALDTAECIGASESCPASTDCGNGSIEGEEQCDGVELGGHTCTSLGFEAGTLGCAANCSFDTTACIDYEGECCDSNGSPGCDHTECASAVCEADPYCCSTNWDGVCAGAAMSEAACGGAPGC